MILPDFDHASDDMALLRRFLPLMRPEASMPVNNDLYSLRDDIHRLVGNVMRVRSAIAAADGTQTRATAITTINETQNVLDALSAEMIRIRCDVIRAFAEPLCAKNAATFRPSPDAGFSGFASPAGA